MTVDDPPMMTRPNQTFNAGLVLGTLLRAGLHAEPLYDERGDYTTRLWLSIFDGEDGVSELRVLIEVDPQPGIVLPSQRTGDIP